jgi:tellurite methyltransferase
MKADREKWNAKYGDAADEMPVCGAVQRFHTLAAVGGHALDIAAGLGGNSLFLADKSFHVDAMDISDIAMDRLEGRHPGITTICTDLDQYRIPAGRYDLIINIHFLNRRLFPLIIEGLKPGGVLIFETFLEGDPQATAEDVNRDYLLRPNELLHAFLKLHILYYEEKENVPPLRASHVAVLVARR